MKVVVALCMLGVAAFLSVSCCPAMKCMAPAKPQRFGSVIGLKADKLAEYKELHAAVWPEVARMLRDCNIRNYSIYLHKLPDGNYYLFSYFEYVGKDLEADVAKLKANPDIQRWWKRTDPLQNPLPDRKEGEWWSGMEEVFHQE